MAGWSERHEGIDPAGVPLLRGWLHLVAALAVPLRAVPPDLVSLAGVGAAVGAAGRARAGAPVAAAALVVASAVLDGVDGAVAEAAGRVSPHGRALDSACDRVAELGHLDALVTGAGVGRGPAAALAGATALVELARWRAGHHLRLTAWERPSRVVLVVVGLLAAAAAPRSARRTGVVTATVGLVLAGTALAQLSGAAGGPSTAASRAGGARGSRR